MSYNTLPKLINPTVSKIVKVIKGLKDPNIVDSSCDIVGSIFNISCAGLSCVGCPLDKRSSAIQHLSAILRDDVIKIPKGLTINELEKVHNYYKKNPDTSFSCSDVETKMYPYNCDGIKCSKCVLNTQDVLKAYVEAVPQNIIDSSNNKNKSNNEQNKENVLGTYENVGFRAEGRPIKLFSGAKQIANGVRYTGNPTQNSTVKRRVGHKEIARNPSVW
jgi:hypothetical protein